jgi:hypothetical protein
MNSGKLVNLIKSENAIKSVDAKITKLNKTSKVMKINNKRNQQSSNIKNY